MALQFFKYDTRFGDTIVDAQATSFGGTLQPYEAEFQFDFDKPFDLQPWYVYRKSASNEVEENTAANVTAYLEGTANAQLTPAVVTIEDRQILDGHITAFSNFAGDVNVTTPVTVPLTSLVGPNNLGYTLSSGGIEIPLDGYYMASWKFTGLGDDRRDIVGSLQVNGVFALETVMANYLVRNAANNIGGISSDLVTLINPLTAGDIVTLVGFRAATQAGAFNLVANITSVNLKYLGQ